MTGKKKKKNRNIVRTEFRKRHEARRRKKDFTRDYEDNRDSVENEAYGQRVSGKGELTRKRTVAGQTQSGEE